MSDDLWIKEDHERFTVQLYATELPNRQGLWLQRLESIDENRVDAHDFPLVHTSSQ